MLNVFENGNKVLIILDKMERIDWSNFKEFANGIEPYITPGKNIFINLHKVFFIDTEGFNSLIALNEKSNMIGGRLRLVQLSPALTDLFNLMELNDKFEWATAEHLSDLAFAG